MHAVGAAAPAGRGNVGNGALMREGHGRPDATDSIPTRGPGIYTL